MGTVKHILSIILQIAGAITIIGLSVNSLCKMVPQLFELKTKFTIWIANKLKYRKFKKLAIKSDIENVINSTVFELQSELPQGWTKRASIKWVPNLSYKGENSLDEIILRIRPLENQDMNLMYGVYSFFDQSMFPRVQTVIPNNIRKSAVLLVSQRAICKKKNYLKEQFEDSILENEVNNDKTILKYFAEFKKIDSRGFFTSVFLREINEFAIRVRFNPLRIKTEKEIGSILLHISKFSDEVMRVGRTAIESMWHREGPITKYAFLLVAIPNAKGTGPYINKAEKRLEEGSERLYLLAREGQKDFAEKVISHISIIEGYKLVEKFTLRNDYKGFVGGIGAIFITKHYKEE